MPRSFLILSVLIAAWAGGNVAVTAAHPQAAPGVTSLTNPAVKFTVPAAHHVQLKRGPVTVIITDNAAVDVPELPAHRAGLNGVASLKHASTGVNFFVPPFSGLNLEVIHDGTGKVNKDIFDPRSSPMQLRVVDEYTVELHQPPTALWQLESCGRFHLLPDGVIEYTFECIPRAATFAPAWFSLFWASYIEQPENNGIRFRGLETGGTAPPTAAPGDKGWIYALSPDHGVDSSIPPAGPLPQVTFTPDFPLHLVTSRSRYVHTEPWYYGTSHGLAYVQMFRQRDGIWFSQSPSGGGSINPAWDFYWFVRDWKVNEAYGLVMRAACLPLKTRHKSRRQRVSIAPRSALPEKRRKQRRAVANPLGRTCFQCPCLPLASVQASYKKEKRERRESGGRPF